MDDPRPEPLTSEPIPDLLDHRGRLRRVGVAAAVATLAAVLVATGTYALARADIEQPATWVYSPAAGAWRFVVSFTIAGWAATFWVALWFLNRRQRRRDSLVPTAVVSPRRDVERS